MSEDERPSLESSDSLNRAMRLIYAWRSDEDRVYRDELDRVLREIHAEALTAMKDVAEDEAAGDDTARVRAYYARRYQETSELIHAFVRATALLVEARTGGLGPEDVLKLVDDVLREEYDDVGGCPRGPSRGLCIAKRAN
jgi:ferredoxin-NADP reductase